MCSKSVTLSTLAVEVKNLKSKAIGQEGDVVEFLGNWQITLFANKLPK